jgi:hypothetical protein
MKYIDILSQYRLLILFVLILILCIRYPLNYVHKDFGKRELDNWHWLQTRNQLEQSGTAILRQSEMRKSSKGQIRYFLELEEQNDSILFKYEYRYTSISDRTCLNAEKVFGILEGKSLNTEIPIRWTTRANGEPILTAIDNQTDIGNNSYGNLLFMLSWMIAAFIFFVIISLLLAHIAEELIDNNFGKSE